MSDYSYYIFKDIFLARSQAFGSYEWYLNGEWRKDFSLSRYLTDCMMGYGDGSPSDYDEISEDEALKFMEKL